MVPASKSASQLEELRSKVEDGLWAIAGLRNLGSVLHYEVHSGGRVEVGGPVPTRLIKEEILTMLNRTPGVNEVMDHIIADPDLEIAVAKALATDDRAKAIPPGSLSVRSHLGNIILFGRIPPEVDRRNVMDLVNEVDGIRGIEDRMLG